MTDPTPVPCPIPVPQYSAGRSILRYLRGKAPAVRVRTPVAVRLKSCR
jgi:hypothetical protein